MSRADTMALRVVSALGVVALAVSGPHPASALALFVAVDTASVAGLYELNESSSAAPVDFDVDGDEDVLIIYHDQGGKLWSNNGNGTYTRVAQAAWPKTNAEGKIPDRHKCDWADVNHDGLPDAYCASGRGGGNSVKTGKGNELWLQRPKGSFTEVGTQWGVGDVCGRSHSTVFLDANGDGYQDIFVGNVNPRPVANDPCDNPANGLTNEESKLYVNVAGQRFEIAPTARGIGGYVGSRCATKVDYNRDGWDDLLACSSQGLKLYRNNAGTGFSVVSAEVNLPATVFNDAKMGDLDGDGDLDLVTILSSKVAYRLYNGGRFGASIVIKSFTGGRWLALGDADGNGALDVYALSANLSTRSNPDDVILLNSALRFTTVAVPPAGGIGDTVVALDGNRDGRTEFLALNGQEDAKGPVQLINLQPAP